MGKRKKVILISAIIIGIAVIAAGIFCFKSLIQKNSAGKLEFFYTDQFNYNYFDGHVENFEKKSDSVISEEELKKVVYKYCNDIFKMGDGDISYEIDPAVYVYLNREKGVFIVNLGVYTKYGELISYDRLSRLYIDASNGEILNKYTLSINDYPLYITENYEAMTELDIDEETAKTLEKVKGKYTEKCVAFQLDAENSNFEQGREVNISETGFTFNGREYFAGYTTEYSPAKFYNIYRLPYEDVKLLFNGNKTVTVLSASNSTDENAKLVICGEDIYLYDSGEFIKLEKE